MKRAKWDNGENNFFYIGDEIVILNSHLIVFKLRKAKLN